MKPDVRYRVQKSRIVSFPGSDKCSSTHIPISFYNHLWISFSSTPSSLKLTLSLRFVDETLCVFPPYLPSHSSPLNLATLSVYAKIGNHSDSYCGIFFLSYPQVFSEFRKRERERQNQTICRICDTILRNVGLIDYIYTAPHPRRRHSSKTDYFRFRNNYE
jgi:hypothetical protein